MLVVNFAHPLTEAQLARIAALTGQAITRTIAVRCQFDADRPFAEQARALVDQAGLSAEDWTILLA